MKHQAVSVDYWSMGKAMFMYGILAVLVWVMLRLFNTAVMLPQRLRNQQRNMEDTLKQLQARYPDLNITEEDLKNAEKELDDFVKENDEKDKDSVQDGTKGPETETPGTTYGTKGPEPGTSKDGEDQEKVSGNATVEESKKSI